MSKAAVRYTTDQRPLLHHVNALNISFKKGRGRRVRTLLPERGNMNAFSL